MKKEEIRKGQAPSAASIPPNSLSYLDGERVVSGRNEKEARSKKKKTNESGMERKVPQRRNSGMYPG